MQADGNTDPFYIRFTTPKQEHLILGTSRAAQGLQPKVFDSILKLNMNNYAFTAYHSPYGPVYYESILKKIKPETTDGVFILSVDPWSISSTAKNPNDSLHFREQNAFLNNTPLVNIKPNPFYLIHAFKGNYTDILKSNNGNQLFLHDDGWLEVTVDMDSSAVSNRTKAKIRSYRTNCLPVYQFSEFRFNYLRKTIAFLSTHGEVYLVRLPVHPEMMAIENEFMPEFDHLMLDLIPSVDVYLNLTNENKNHQYIDGNHLFKNSGKTVSQKIALWIKNKRLN
jgi:hypothetical protein